MEKEKGESEENYTLEYWSQAVISFLAEVSPLNQLTLLPLRFDLFRGNVIL